MHILVHLFQNQKVDFVMWILQLLDNLESCTMFQTWMNCFLIGKIMHSCCCEVWRIHAIILMLRCFYEGFSEGLRSLIGVFGFVLLSFNISWVGGDSNEGLHWLLFCFATLSNFFAKKMQTNLIYACVASLSATCLSWILW